MASLKAQCPPPRPQLGSSCLRLSLPAHHTPCSQGFFAPNGKHFIPIICEAPLQMTLTQHGKDLLPSIQHGSLGVETVSEVRNQRASLAKHLAVWPDKPRNHPSLHCGWQVAPPG